MSRTIGCSDAAQLLGLSEQLLRWRANHGKIAVAHRRPLRFSVAVLLENRDRMQVKSARGRKPLSKLEEIIA
jgi:hypothetical protein